MNKKDSSYKNNSTKNILEQDINSLLKEKHKLIKEIEKKEKHFIQCIEKEKRYKSIFELSSDAILIIEGGKFVECNNAALKMLKYKTKKEFLNTHPSVLSPEKQPDGRYSYEKAEEMMNIALKKGIHKFEWIHTRSDGENFPVEVWLSTVKYNDKIVINTIWRDLTEKKRKEAIILKSIKEKETLLKEIHHRVKNNFQIISSLLSLQSEYVDDLKFQKLCIQCKNRIESMCMIHEMMYGAENLSSISFKNYSENLLNNIIKSSSKDKIKYIVTGDDIYLNLDSAIPIGLILNEIITNSIKYAFKTNTSENKININIKSTKKKVKILIEDNGIGFNSEKFKDNTNTLGIQLIFSLINQIEGNITKLKTKIGTAYLIELYSE